MPEIVLVLQSFYKVAREAIADALQNLINGGGAVETDRPAVLHDALERYRRHPQVDVGDAMLGALAAEQNLPVASFDRNLDRFKEVTRFEPPTQTI